MSLKQTVTIIFLTCELGWCITELETHCIATYNADFSNDFLEGTWYHILKFSWIGLLPTTECPTYTYRKPNSTDLKRYEEEYSKPNAPFSVKDTPLHEDGGVYHPYGVLVGNKQAKFFIIDPSSPYYKPPFIVRIYQKINDEFVLYHDCSSRGRWQWLMSRKRNPLQADVDLAVGSRPDIVDKSMQRRWYCALR